MLFNDHSTLAGAHAFLGASTYHWINYDEQKLAARWHSARSAALGVALHEYARSAIKLGIKQAANGKTLNQYINDAIGYKMSVEQPLRYSDNAFGTADAISFRRSMLRIHDLKTGVTPCKFPQLWVYAAYFCLEYGYDPFDIKMEFRIYQSDEVLIEIGDPETIARVMEQTIRFDNLIEEYKEAW
jgi:hypothetical protein